MSINSMSGDEQAFSKLSQSEKRALFLLSEGRTNGEIARALSLGEGTVRNYLSSILSKLGFVNQAEAITYAIKHDLRGHMGLGDSA